MNMEKLRGRKKETATGISEARRTEQVLCNISLLDEIPVKCVKLIGIQNVFFTNRKFSETFPGTYKVRVKRSHYRPEQAQSVPGG